MIIIGAMLVGILMMLVVLAAVVMGGALAHKGARGDAERDAVMRATRRERDGSGPGPLGGEPVPA
ncbi:hypothetical protein OV207_34595 [Corallococcus sp. BB11-1]|uniref:hypothetical protein n=1 Tax=Corallococcus sp. BB11-1 TaxID=2996783 RepID=UPI00226D5039|nr:hypothetical protein [Corallococcus sp. BB11-1]MCY1036618.1 hypothetical protein [Corallococcus sp. BB11-1]